MDQIFANADGRANLVRKQLVQNGIERGTITMNTTTGRSGAGVATLLTPEQHAETQNQLQQLQQGQHQPNLVPPPPTALPNINSITTSTSGTINKGLKKEVYLSLVKERNGLAEVVQNMNHLLSQSNTLAVDLNQQISTKDAALKAANDDLKKANDDLQKANDDNEKHEGRVSELEKEVANLQDCLAKALAALKDAGKFSEFEQNDAVKKEINAYVKDFVSRKTKFARDEELAGLTAQVYDALKVKLGLDKGDNAVTEDDFVRIYQSYVQDCLSRRRQYVQTQLFEAFKSKSRLS